MNSLNSFSGGFSANLRQQILQQQQQQQLQQEQQENLESVNTNMSLIQQQILLDEALEAAWAQYGPKSKSSYEYNNSPPLLPLLPPPQILINNPMNPSIPLPPGGLYYSPNFQPMESEWDQHVGKSPVPYKERKVLQPGIFNRMLSSYIDFEVNHHEVADAIRKVVFAFFAGLLILGWGSLGFYLCFNLNESLSK